MRTERLRYEFVEHIPAQPIQGVLYVSLPFTTAVHLCCCGCGGEVVTPLSPTDWQFTFDGESITLHPSIGNWSFACQSHYWIRHNAIEWAPRWSSEQIALGRRSDRQAKEQQFAAADRAATRLADTPRASDRVSRLRQRLRGLLRRVPVLRRGERGDAENRG